MDIGGRRVPVTSADADKSASARLASPWCTLCYRRSLDKSTARPTPRLR